MFAVHCPSHDARVLIFPSGVDAIVNGPAGMAVHYHCTCGHRGVWYPHGGPGGVPHREAPALQLSA